MTVAEQTFIFSAPDDQQIYCHRWPVKEPRTSLPPEMVRVAMESLQACRNKLMKEGKRVQLFNVGTGRVAAAASMAEMETTVCNGNPREGSSHELGKQNKGVLERQGIPLFASAVHWSAKSIPDGPFCC